MTDELTMRLLCAIGGLFAGLVLGWSSRAARDARAVRKALMDDTNATPERRRPWKPKRSDVVWVFWFVLFAMMLFATISTVQTNSQLERETARVDRVSACNVKVSSDLLRAVNERTTFTEESAKRDRELQNAEKAMLTGVLNPAATRDQRRKAVEGYVHALDVYQAVQAKAAKNRKAWPYPEQKEIEKCR